MNIRQSMIRMAALGALALASFGTIAAVAVPTATAASIETGPTLLPVHRCAGWCHS